MGELDKGIITRMTAEQLVATYCAVKGKIAAAHAELEAANAMMLATGNKWSEFFVSAPQVGHYARIEDVYKKLRRDFWRHILNLVDLRKYATEKRYEDLLRRIDDDKVEEPSVEAIFAAMLAMQQNLSETIREKVIEVYKYLTPGQSCTKLKTNKASRQAGIGKKVILTGVYYHYAGSHLNALEEVFYLLDGKTKPDNPYNGEIYQGVSNFANGRGDGCGENQYFRWRYYRNQHLHIEFKRPDIVQQIIQLSAEQVLREGI